MECLTVSTDFLRAKTVRIVRTLSSAGDRVWFDVYVDITPRERGGRSPELA
jgi:hypothetical protein